MPFGIQPLTKYLASLLGQGIGKAINWYVSRNYPSNNIVNRLISRGFQNTSKTVTALINFSQGKQIIANQIFAGPDGFKINAMELPSAVVKPAQIRVTYDIHVDDEDARREMFGNLITDCDDALTKKQLLKCVYEHADSFLTYFDYDVKSYHVTIKTIEGY